MAIDTVRPLKLETPAEGGTQTDYLPTEVNVTNDYVASKGLSIEGLQTIYIDRSSNNMQFTDVTSGTRTLISLYTALTNTFDNSTNNFAATNVQAAIEEARNVNSLAISFFGSGQDGDVSLSSGTTTLSRDMWYSNLTLSGTAQLDTNGYRVFVRNTLSISGSAILSNNGNNGGNASGTTPGTAGALTQGVTVGAGQAGNAGGSPNNDSRNLSALTGYGGAGTSGGAGGGNGGPGSAGTYTYSPEYGFREDHFIPGSAPSYKFGGGGSTGGNGGNQAVLGTAGAGGGGGSGGGVVYVIARIFTNTSSGGIQAKGGNGGNGSAASAGGIGGSGGGGGGSGGGGGFVYLVTNILTLGNISVAGGSGGTGGAGAGGGAAGSSGSSGSTGHYTVYHGYVNTWTVL